MKVDEQSASFANIADVLGHLKRAGWKVTRSSLYRHHQEGKFVARDGAYLHKDVDRYARTWLKKESTGKRERDGIDELQRKKAERELKRLDLEIQQRELVYAKELGKLVPREQIEVEMAGRAAVLDAGLRHWVHANAAEWVRTVAGDSKKVGDLILLMGRSLDEHINNYAAPRDYRIVIEDEPEPAEEIAKGGDDDGSEEAGEGYYGITAEAEDVQG